MDLRELARRIDATLEGASFEVRGLAPIEDAGPDEVSFVANPRYVSRIGTTGAGALILAPGVEGGDRPVLRAVDPYQAFVRALELFHVPVGLPDGVHPSAVVAESARVGARASIGPYAVIGERAVVGDDARIAAHVVVYAEATIGHRFVAHAGAVVRERVRIGDDVVLQPGAVIGGDGFGYVPDAEKGVRAIPQTGTVVLEDGVEVGSNSTIDRAAVGTTRIRKGAKIDNLVMVAHGCDVGPYSFLAAQVGIAGSTKIGTGVQLGGQTGVTGHLEIGDGVRAGAQSGINNDVAAGKTLLGVLPAMDLGLGRRVAASFPKLPELLRRVARLERHLGLRPGRASREP